MATEQQPYRAGQPLVRWWRGRRVGNAAAVAIELGFKRTTFNSYRTRVDILQRPPGPVRYTSTDWDQGPGGEWDEGPEVECVLTHPETGEWMYDLDEQRTWGENRRGRGWRAGS